MRVIAALAVFATLSACGVDGAPTRPSGTASLAVGSNGVSVGGSVSVSNGPISVTVTR